MKVAIVYTTKSKNVIPVLDAMAKWARTHIQNVQEYLPQETVDLLVIGFDASLKDDQELLSFISKLDRKYVKNVALVNSFYMYDKCLERVMTLCQNQYLPLMREQYSFKMTLDQRKEIHPTIINNARLYIEDLMTVIHNYY